MARPVGILCIRSSEMNRLSRTASNPDEVNGVDVHAQVVEERRDVD